MITCLFSCEECGLVDCRVKVRARERSDDVDEWIEGTLIEAISGHHSLMSPLCRSKQAIQFKIPIEDRADFWFGRQTDRVPPIKESEPTDHEIPVTPPDA